MTNTLFNMIFILAIMILIIHKKDLDEKNSNVPKKEEIVFNKFSLTNY